MSALLGYENGAPQNCGQMYPDAVAGLCGLAAIATALLREGTGRGQHIDLSMQEANFTFIGEAWLEYAVTGHVRGPMGNRHPLFAPHGIYPCAGVDQRIAISAETDAQFTAIAATLGLDTAGLTDNAARESAEDHLDELIAAKTATRNKHGLADALTAGGVPAAPVLDAAEVVADQNLRVRGHLVHVDHPETGPMWQSGLAGAVQSHAVAAPRPAPLQGQHSAEVFGKFLEMDERRYEELVRRGIIGEGPVVEQGEG